MTRYWFRPRYYGYGATPISWEGWLVTLVSAAFIAGSIVAMNLLTDRFNFTAWIIWAVVVAIVTLAFVQISRRRTDGEWRWRWGAKSKS